MKRLIRTDNILTLVLFHIILLSLPGNLTARPKPMGGVSIFRENIYDSDKVKINGNTATNDQTVTSPCIVETPSTETDLTIYFGKAGLMNFGSDTKMNLSFDENKISGALLKGRMTVLLMPATTLSVQTRDGVVKVISQNQETNISINYVKGKTQVRAFSGAALLNGVSIAEGQYFIAGEAAAKDAASLKSLPFLDHLVTTVEVMISSILGSTDFSDSNVDNSQINVGPMR